MDDNAQHEKEYAEWEEYQEWLSHQHSHDDPLNEWEEE